MGEIGFTAKRKPWLAGLLSGILPGLGQLYNGQIKKAILFAVLPLLMGGLTLVVLILYDAPLHPPYKIVLLILLAAGIVVAVVRDAIRVAREQGTDYALKSCNKWYVYLAFVLVFGIGVELIHLVIQAVKIPAARMTKYAFNPKNEGTVFIFLHGIFGDAYGTWTSHNGRRYFDLMREDDLFKDADFYVYGFPSENWGASFSIDQAARDLHAYLQSDRFSTMTISSLFAIAWVGL